MSIIFQQSKKIGHFTAHMKIQQIPPDDNRPDGFKVNFVLIDDEMQKPVFLIDNHKPFGYHIHPNLNKDHSDREEIVVSSPFEALDLFLERIKEITKNG